MIKPTKGLLALALLGALGIAPAAFADDDKRPADKIAADYNAIEVPKPDMSKRGDRDYIMKFRDEFTKAIEKRSALALEMYKAAPDDARVPDMLLERWQPMMMNPGMAKTVLAEVDDALPKFKDEKKARNAGYMKAIAAINSDADKALPTVDAFIKGDPKDPRNPILLSGLAGEMTDTNAQIDLMKRLVAEYPDSRPAQAAKGQLHLMESVGKPIKLEFAEATTGTNVSLEGLKGKVVVLDFWATWCGPCIAEMPNMKKLYAEFKPKGVEFIGVSLDSPKEEGGLDKLKEYVAKNNVTWPQYYQGNGWDSDFSRGLGIDSIPRLFLIDADGNLADINARGKLETLLPEYLAKAKKADKPASTSTDTKPAEKPATR